MQTVLQSPPQHRGCLMSSQFLIIIILASLIQCDQHIRGSSVVARDSYDDLTLEVKFHGVLGRNEELNEWIVDKYMGLCWEFTCQNYVWYCICYLARPQCEINSIIPMSELCLAGWLLSNIYYNLPCSLSSTWYSTRSYNITLKAI